MLLPAENLGGKNVFKEGEDGTGKEKMYVLRRGQWGGKGKNVLRGGWGGKGKNVFLKNRMGRDTIFNENIHPY